MHHFWILCNKSMLLKNKKQIKKLNRKLIRPRKLNKLKNNDCKLYFNKQKNHIKI